MRRAAGQVARSAHRLAHGLLAACILLLLGLTALALRLSQGPIPMDALARAIETRANRDDGAMRIEIASASIGWEGMQMSGMTPLDLRLSGVKLRDREGALRIELPEASASLAIPWLLRGQIAPGRLELRHLTLRLHRFADGRVALSLGEPEAAAADQDAESGGGSLDELLAEMMRPPAGDTPLGALQLLRIADARMLVEDDQIGAAWSLERVTLDLARRPQGGVDGRGNGLLRIGEARIPVQASAIASGDPADIAFRIGLPGVQPRQLAAALPGLVPLQHLDAPIRAEVTGRMRGDGTGWSLGVTTTAGAGTLDLGGIGRLALASADLTADYAPDGLVLRSLRLVPSGAGAPTIHGSGRLDRGEAGWTAEARFGLDQAPAARITEWWPEGLAPGARAWIGANVTAGQVRAGQWRVTAEAGPDLAGPRLTGLSGTLDVADATVRWLHPIPPAEAASGRITFAPDAITVEVAQARQAGTRIESRGGTVRIAFPPGEVETAEINLPLAGPAGDALTLLKHERLRLFERRPLPIQDARGSVEARLTVALPLLNDLPMDRLAIAGQGRLRDLRLPDIALGKPLERGQIAFSVDVNGLRASGTAALGEIPGRLTLDLDFRAGQPSQVIMRATMQGRATGAQLAALGLGSEDLLRGNAGLNLEYVQRRTGPARLTARADLRDAALDLAALRWSKPVGQNGGADAVLRINGASLEAIESFRIEAPALLLRGNATFARGARLEQATIAEGRLENSRFTGEVRPPAPSENAWQVTLRGAVLDLRRLLADDAPAGPPAQPADPGPAIALQARFDRVLLGPLRELAAVEGRVSLDRYGVIRAGTLGGRTGAQGAFQATIAPQGAGRSLRITAEDAGALLHRLDVLRHLEGGRLTVTAEYAHNAPGAPLSGTAEMSDFVVHNAPAFGKLLQAMSLFGLFDALSGPGLNFATLVAPFTLTPDALTLEDARAFSASLGLTARGTLDRRRGRIAMDGTIVPAYILNSMLGHIPLLGRIFSPERGGGLFAATFRLNGPLADPQVSINPLAALTPGFLRGLFDIGRQPDP